jgi:AraC-like DNA-binding protein
MLDVRFRFQEPLVEQVMRAVVAGGSRLFLESAAVLVLERLARLPSVERRVGSTSRIRLATEYMHANLDQPISLNELSRVTGLSPSHLLRVFKATTTLSPHRYLTRARLERAKDLLARGEADIADVALAVGFSSQSHFTSAFRGHYGTTPAAFKKSVVSDLSSQE